MQRTSYKKHRAARLAKWHKYYNNPNNRIKILANRKEYYQQHKAERKIYAARKWVEFKAKRDGNNTN
jgi:hypothetical protein